MNIEHIDVVSNDNSNGNYLTLSNGIFDLKGNNIGNLFFILFAQHKFNL